MIIYLLIGVAIFGVIVLAYMLYEASTLELQEVPLTNGTAGLKAIHLSDIHIGLMRVNVEKISIAIKKQKPDILIMTGDYVESRRQIPAFLRFLDRITGDYEIFLCFGNHDYKTFGKNKSAFDDFVSQIEARGVRVLLNASTVYTKGDKAYNLIGIEDFRSKLFDIKKALSSCISNATANIAFSHNPDIALELPKNEVDFLLCGHFHGGQIWLPFDFEFTILRHERVCKLGIKKGLNKLDNMIIYISRGIGNVLVPLRLFSPPEITVLYFP